MSQQILEANPKDLLHPSNGSPSSQKLDQASCHLFSFKTDTKKNILPTTTPAHPTTVHLRIQTLHLQQNKTDSLFRLEDF